MGASAKGRKLVIHFTISPTPIGPITFHTEVRILTLIDQRWVIDPQVN